MKTNVFIQSIGVTKKILFIILIIFESCLSFGQLQENDAKVLETRSNEVYEHYQNSNIATILSGVLTP